MIRSEERGVWRELEVRLRPYVARRLSSPADVEDVLQNVAVRIHRGLAELRDGERFGAWVYRIAERAIFDQRRERARHPFAAPDSTDAHVDEGTADEREELAAEMAGCLALFVARLPSPYREAITLTELQGLTQKDAAEMAGVSLSGMKSRVQRGRERLRRMFEECCEVTLDRRGRVTECLRRGRAGSTAGGAGAG